MNKDVRTRSALVHVWDALVWILVIFPLLTGGIWIRRPGLKLELAELGAPVLIVSLLAALFYFWKRVDLSEASSVRLALKLWERWNEGLDQRPKSTLWSTALVVAAILSLSSLRRHWAYGSHAFDLGIFTNAIWNLTHGNGYVSSVKNGINLFADHQSPIFWLFAPAFKLFPYPETLLILQALGLSTGGVALYWIGKQYLSKESRAWAAALPVLYWMYLPTRNANAFDFHPEVLMLPAFLWGIWGMQSEQGWARLLGFIFLLLGLGAKESSGPVAVGVGAAWLLGGAPEQTRLFCRKVGLALIGVGVAVFYVDTQVIPQSLGSAYAYSTSYSQYGGGITSILLSPLTKPTVFWPQMLGPSRLKFLLWTLGPLSFLPLLGWRTFVAATPSYIILFLSEGNTRLNLQYHYATEPSIGLFWSMAPALSLVTKFPPALSRKIAWGMVFFALLFFGRSEFYRARINTPTAHTQWISREVIPSLSQNSYAVPGGMVPHLSTRPWVQYLPITSMPNGQTVECVILDPSLNNWPVTDEDARSLNALLRSGKFKSVFQCGGLEIFQNEASSTSCMSREPVCPSH